MSPLLQRAKHDSHCFQGVSPLSVVLSALSLSSMADVYWSMHLLQPFGSCLANGANFRQSSLLCLNSGPFCLHPKYGLLRGLPVPQTAVDVLLLS